MAKGPWQAVKDLLFAPFRLIVLSDEGSRRLGLTSLEDERIKAVLPCIAGRLLDIGAGTNRLVREYGSGIGVDVYDWDGGALIVEDTAHLPFDDGAFDTVTFVACLNHIPYRDAALREAHRLLRDGGVCIITMIGPLLGWLGHKLWWYSEDKERGMADGEAYGLSASAVCRLAEDAGFVLQRHARFVYGLNNLYRFAKVEDAELNHVGDET